MKNLILFGKTQVSKMVHGIIIISSFLAINKSVAQTELMNHNKVGLALGSFISGNGHGTIYSPQLCFNNLKNALFLGACLQKRAMKFNGIRVAYSFVLNSKPKQRNDEDEEEAEEAYQYFGGSNAAEPKSMETESRVSFKLYMYAEFLKKNLLSHCTQKMEAHVNRVEGVNWSQVRLNTIEGGIGGQIGVKLGKNFYWNGYVCASFYYHTTYVNNMHHERFSPCLTLGTNITIPSIKILS